MATLYKTVILSPPVSLKLNHLPLTLKGRLFAFFKAPLVPKGSCQRSWLRGWKYATIHKPDLRCARWSG